MFLKVPMTSFVNTKQAPHVARPITLESFVETSLCTTVVRFSIVYLIIDICCDILVKLLYTLTIDSSYTCIFIM